MIDHSPEQHSWRLQGAVYGTAFFNGTVQSMATMVTALLVGGLIGTGLPFLIALVLASRQILTVTMSIYGGALMDHFGTRRIVIVFGLIGGVAAALYPVLPAVFGPAPLSGGGAAMSWLFVAAIIMLQMVSGYAEGTSWIGSQTMVGTLLKGHPVYAGRMTFTARIGGILGPLAIGGAWDGWGAWGGFGFLAVWIFCGTVAAMFLPKTENGISPGAEGAAEAAVADGAGSAEIRPRASDYAATLRLLLFPAIAMVIIITMLRQTGSGVQSSFYVVWLDNEIGLSGTLIGALLGASSAAAAIAALATGPLVRRFADHWLLVSMIGLSIVAIAVTPLLGDIYVLLLIAICARGLGQGLNLPLMITILARSVSADLHGRVTALRISFNRLGGAAVPLIMGALAEIVGIANSFYIVGAAGIVMLGLLSLWIAKSPAFRPADPTDR